MPDASHPGHHRSASAELTDRAAPPPRSSKRASTGPLANLTALGVLVVAAVSLLMLSPRSEQTPPTGAIPSSTSRASQLPSAPATSGPTAEPAGSAASTPPFVRHGGLQAELASIPPDAPDATISEAEAIAIALDHMNVPRSVEPIIVEHGVGLIRGEQTATVWLVVMPIPEASPYPVGPMCPDTGESCHWMLDDYAGALVSDQTAQVGRSFTVGHPVSDPRRRRLPEYSGAERPDDSRTRPSGLLVGRQRGSLEG